MNTVKSIKLQNNKINTKKLQIGKVIHSHDRKKTRKHKQLDYNEFETKNIKTR